MARRRWVDRTRSQPLTSPTPGTNQWSSWHLTLPLVLVGIAWLQELIDTALFAGGWNLPLGPGSPWWSLITAPFSHGGIGHLLANTLIFLPLSYLVMSQGLRAYLSVWVGVILMEIPIWLFWPTGSHGLSGVVYGLLGYLVLLGLIERRLISLAITVLVLSLYGSSLVGLFPWATPPGVSWIGHFSGFVGGALAALACARNPQLP